MRRLSTEAYEVLRKGRGPGSRGGKVVGTYPGGRTKYAQRSQGTYHHDESPLEEHDDLDSWTDAHKDKSAAWHSEAAKHHHEKGHSLRRIPTERKVSRQHLNLYALHSTAAKVKSGQPGRYNLEADFRDAKG